MDEYIEYTKEELEKMTKKQLEIYYNNLGEIKTDLKFPNKQRALYAVINRIRAINRGIAFRDYGK